MTFSQKSEIKKIEISLDLVKFCYVWAWALNLRAREQESHALPSRRRTLNNRQTLVTNKAATYAIKMPRLCSKIGTKFK